MDIKIIIAIHKKCRFPKDSVYLPLQVGAYGKESLGIERDDTGINISDKNYYFNEMTAVYWAWKNLKSEYVGLNHYRRYFSKNDIIKKLFCKDKYSLIMTGEELAELLRTTDIVLPRKRKYYIETIESHYLHLPYTVNNDLFELCNVVKEISPDYYDTLRMVLNRKWAHMFNMYIMKRKYFDEFCKWAFEVLFEVDKRINMKGRKKEEARMYISEFLVDTWIEKNKYDYIELDVLNTEGDNLLKKGIILIVRKIRAMFENTLR